MQSTRPFSGGLDARSDAHHALQNNSRFSPTFDERFDMGAQDSPSLLRKVRGRDWTPPPSVFIGQTIVPVSCKENGLIPGNTVLPCENPIAAIAMESQPFAVPEGGLSDLSQLTVLTAITPPVEPFGRIRDNLPVSLPRLKDVGRVRADLPVSLLVPVRTPTGVVLSTPPPRRLQPALEYTSYEVTRGASSPHAIFEEIKTRVVMFDVSQPAVYIPYLGDQETPESLTL